ncbi:hypothetical protein HBI56_055920 [Parastagonospora nodorum]|nr:hypothetical protein HBI10_068900 [Parastagonospora nodorum]KAH4028022.1 hypothetical protein HBI13_049110 [Parastagonospora nodorum]KAH4343934.1 hypothetical protein HBH98_141680 [Parastagonospora nodorum]KAH4372125.1 hypothetical protein HBH97_134060 [Parastagonospora nodorum]KAH4380507.1 hypothetical protein HBH99_195910 [Parastagonospora nodorum]
MNSTSDFLALPTSLFRGATNALPSFSFVQVPHIKPEAEHQALVLFDMVKIGLAYREGWRDGRKNSSAREAVREPDKKSREKTRKNKTKGSRVIGRGKYTIVFQ